MFKHDFYKIFLIPIFHSLLEGITGASGLTNMDCSIHKVVLDNGKLEDDKDQMIQKHQLYLPKRKKKSESYRSANVVSGKSLFAPLLIFIEGWTVVGSKIVLRV